MRPGNSGRIFFNETGLYLSYAKISEIWMHAGYADYCNLRAIQ